LTPPQAVETPDLIVHQRPSLTPRGWSTAAHLPDDPASSLTLFLPPLSLPPLPGDTLTAPFGVLSPPRPPMLPHLAHQAELRLMRGHLGTLSLHEPPTIIPPLHPSPALRLQRVLAQRHTALSSAIWALPLPDHQRALTIAMALGDRALLSDNALRPFRLTGTSHILAISGLHVGALLLTLLTLTRLALARLLPRHTARYGALRIALPLLLPALLLYLGLLGAPISALRATLMALPLLVAPLLHRRPHPLRALAIACLFIAALHPANLLDPALWLSASATAAILLAWQRRPALLRGPGRGAEPRWRFHLRRVASAPYTSAAAWLATAPIVLHLGGQLPLCGLLLNPIVIPITSLIAFPALSLATLLVQIAPAASTALITLGAGALDLCAALCAAVASLPGATWTPGAPPLPATLLALACAATALTAPRARLTLLAALTSLAIPAACARWQRPPADTLRLHFIPVGQGDATLIQTPDGQNILVDAGGAAWGADPGEQLVAPYLKHIGVAKLDAVILTHADLDHMGGLPAIAHHLPIRRFVYPGDDPSKPLLHLSLLMAERGATLVPAHRNMALSPHITLLKPPFGEGNDSSLILSIRHAGLHALLAGDLEAAGEHWLVGTHPGEVHVLKMPHHGSRTSSSQALIDATTPTVAIASSALHGRFEHPHPEVVRRYQRAGARTLGTDRHGLILADLSPDHTLRLFVQRPAGPIPLILPQIAHHLWKTCHVFASAEAHPPHRTPATLLAMRSGSCARSTQCEDEPVENLW
jgi:competence protein ComEC